MFSFWSCPRDIEESVLTPSFLGGRHHVSVMRFTRFVDPRGEQTLTGETQVVKESSRLPCCDTSSWVHKRDRISRESRTLRLFSFNVNANNNFALTPMDDYPKGPQRHGNRCIYAMYPYASMIDHINEGRARVTFWLTGLAPGKFGSWPSNIP